MTKTSDSPSDHYCHCTVINFSLSENSFHGFHTKVYTDHIIIIKYIVSYHITKMMQICTNEKSEN